METYETIYEKKAVPVEINKKELKATVVDTGEAFSFVQENGVWKITNGPDEAIIVQDIIELSSDVFRIHIKGFTFDVQVIDELEYQSREETGSGLVQSPMAGVVTKIAVKAGDSVAVGSNLLLLSAMKMENEINSPISGTVKKVLVEEGQQVNPGQLLVELEQVA